MPSLSIDASVIAFTHISRFAAVLIQIRPALFPVVPAIFGLSCFGSPARHSRHISPLRNALDVAPIVALTQWRTSVH
jgi:hypothetical protein